MRIRRKITDFKDLQTGFAIFSNPFLSVLRWCHKNIKWNYMRYSATVFLKLNLKMVTSKPLIMHWTN